MAKLESNLINMVLVLTGISLFAAVALGSVYSATQGPIEESKTAKQQNAIKEVLPAFDRLNEPEAIEITGVGSFDIYKAFDSNDNFVGAAVESSRNGFSGEIKIMVGFDKDGNIVNYSVLEQKETPGLGTKMVDWFKPQGKVEKSLIEKLFGFEVQVEERKSSIIGMNPANNKISVTKDGGEIDAITAATISSRAFLEAVQYAYAAYANNPEAIDISSGATAASEPEGANSTNHKTDAESGATTDAPESADKTTNTESRAIVADPATTDATSAASSTQTDGTSSATTAVDTIVSKDAN